jgi:hypothetical protein
MRILCNGRSPAQVAALVTLAAALLTACTEAPTRTEAISRATAVQSP